VSVSVLLNLGNKMKALQSFMGLAVLGAFASSAQATIINFDDLSEGTLVSNQYSGVTFAGGTGGLSVPFGTGGTAAWATNTSMDVTSSTGFNAGGGVTPPISGMLLHGVNGWNAENNDPVFNMTFADEITAISIDFGGVGTTGDSRILAYKTGSTTASYSVATTTTGTSTINLSGMVGVTKIIVTPGDFFDWVGVDNINYTSSSVPEPASFAILGLGAVALIRRRKK
jgi:hypothetical protein